MLRHVETRDQSEPRMWRIEAEDVRTKEMVKDQEDDDDEDDTGGVGKRKWGIEEMKLETGPNEIRSQDVRETSVKETTEVSKVTKEDDDAISQADDDDGEKSGSKVRFEKYSISSPEKSVTSSEVDEKICLGDDGAGVTSEAKSQRVPEIDIALHVDDECVNNTDSEPSKQIEINNDNLESRGSDSPSQQQRYSQPNTDRQETSGEGPQEIEPGQDVSDKTNKIGQVRPLSPTEMQDMSDKSYQEDEEGKSELEIPKEGAKTHKRSSSNVTLEEMAAMAMDMRNKASGSTESSPQHRDERGVGFAEALGSTSDTAKSPNVSVVHADSGMDTATDTSSPAKSVDAPLTDSDVENMEPLFSD